MKVRSSYKPYLAAVDNYIGAMAKQIRSLQVGDSG